ncbi:MAG: NAD(P)H-dependent oxidoreductase subunit E [Micrococcales bacterium]|nr:NAD(P)H-dependent oxidoreductase subunit E [Micrococcales bacterium]
MSGIPDAVAAEHADLVAAVDGLVERYGNQRRALLPVLEGLREQHRQLDDVTMQVVADRLGIAPVDVEGVVTFYHFLGTEPTGRHTLHICRTISCALAGMGAIVKRLENETGIKMGQTTPDGAVTLEWANCIGMCDEAPGMLVDRKAMGRVTPDDACAIVASLRDEVAAAATAGAN